MNVHNPNTAHAAFAGCLQELSILMKSTKFARGMTASYSTLLCCDIVTELQGSPPEEGLVASGLQSLTLKVCGQPLALLHYEVRSS